MLIGNLGKHTSLYTSALWDYTRSFPTFADRRKVPTALTHAAQRFYDRIQDLLFIVTAPQSIFVYALASNGCMKDANESFDEVLTYSQAPDLEYHWLQVYISNACYTWLKAHREGREVIEEQLVEAFDTRGWPTAVERAFSRTTVVLAWSAFEAFASDLWIEAVDALPDPLLARTLGEHKIRKDDLTKFAALVGGKLGAAVCRKMGMTNTDRILAAYKATFSAATLPFLEPPTNAALVKLEKSRHLIVHRGGVIDDEFIAATATGVKDQQMAITIDDACELANAGIRAGVDLIRFVGNWFIANT